LRGGGTKKKTFKTYLQVPKHALSITAAAVLLVICVIVFFIFDSDERVKSAPMSIAVRSTNTGRQ
jgi:hypothetical protein